MLKMKDVPTTADSMSCSPRSKCIKEDEHMHSQKNFGGQKDFAKIRCALATATCLQHPERLARPRHGGSELKKPAASICATALFSDRLIWVHPPDSTDPSLALRAPGDRRRALSFPL